MARGDAAGQAPAGGSREPGGQLLERAERLKTGIRVKVEHRFQVIMNLFRHKTVRYKGLAKSEAQLFSPFGQANLVFAKRQLMALRARGTS